MERKKWLTLPSAALGLTLLPSRSLPRWVILLVHGGSPSQPVDKQFAASALPPRIAACYHRREKIIPRLIHVSIKPVGEAPFTIGGTHDRPSAIFFMQNSAVSPE